MADIYQMIKRCISLLILFSYTFSFTCYNPEKSNQKNLIIEIYIYMYAVWHINLHGIFNANAIFVEREFNLNNN